MLHNIDKNLKKVILLKLPLQQLALDFDGKKN